MVVTQTGLGGVASDTVMVTVSASAPPTTPPPTTPPPGTPPAPGSGLGTANLQAARLLEQAAFGPTPAALARVRLIGIAGWLNELGDSQLTSSCYYVSQRWMSMRMLQT